MEQGGKKGKLDRETTVLVLFLVGMAVYYGWRMFALTPWYDELYTYYYFISRGPVYAAIHWPLPNNHIGYSVLSACLGLCGNATVALRGVSYLCSVGSLILIFVIGRKCLGRGYALIPVFLYAGMKVVNQLAVQGRGYALVSFCYLAAIYALLGITVEHRKRLRDDMIFGMSLVLALYAIPSSLYVVLPLCLTGGIVLLMDGAYRRLGRLILTALAAAVCTVGLYGVVWLAIGSNLLTKTEGSAYYGMGHGAIILHAPFRALQTGIDYMLATPYIQSVGGEGFWGRWIGWLQAMLNEYYAGGGIPLAVLLLVCIIYVTVVIIKKRTSLSARFSFGRRGTDTGSVEQAEIIKNMCYDKGEPSQRYDTFMACYLAVSLVGLPLLLLCMRSLPYYRVFSFAGVAVSLGLAWLWRAVCRRLADRRYGGYIPVLGSAAAGVLCIGLLLTPAYRAQYSDREAAVADAYSQMDLSDIGKIGVTDCDQEYLLLFLYDIGENGVTRDLAQADVVLADKYLLADYDTGVTDWSGDEWKLYLTREAFAAAQADDEWRAIYENDRFILYEKEAR